MGTTTKTVGGGSATGLADTFVDFLMNGLQTGTFGAGTPAGVGSPGGITSDAARNFLGLPPIASTPDSGTNSAGIAGVLNDIFSAGGGKVGGAISDMIKQNDADQVAALRARFGAHGGTAFGTGAQHAEGVLRAREAPALTSAIGQLQLQYLAPIISAITGLSAKGIPQAETITEPSMFSQIVQGVGAVAPIIAAPFTGGASLAASPMFDPEFLSQGPHVRPGSFVNNVGPGTMPQLGSITLPG